MTTETRKLTVPSPSILDFFTDFIHATSNEDLITIEKILKIPFFDINFQDSNGDSLLHHCTSFGKYEIVKKLLVKGATVDICNVKGETPLIIASCIENLEICHLLIRYNANINHSDNGGLTALHWAVMRGSTQAVKFLISYKANINCLDKAGNTPLHLSALYEYLEITKLLLKNHAEINVRTLHGTTPLHHACEKGNIGITQLLLKKKIGINVQDESGFTCLHLAVKSGKISLVKLLLEYGADQTIQNLDGKTPLAFADTVEMNRVFLTCESREKIYKTPYEDWVYICDKDVAPGSPIKSSCEVPNLLSAFGDQNDAKIIDLPVLAHEPSPELETQPPYFQSTSTPLTPVPLSQPTFISNIRSALEEDLQSPTLLNNDSNGNGLSLKLPSSNVETPLNPIDELLEELSPRRRSDSLNSNSNIDEIKKLFSPLTKTLSDNITTPVNNNNGTSAPTIGDFDFDLNNIISPNTKNSLINNILPSLNNHYNNSIPEKSKISIPPLDKCDSFSDLDPLGGISKSSTLQSSSLSNLQSSSLSTLQSSSLSNLQSSTFSNNVFPVNPVSLKVDSPPIQRNMSPLRTPFVPEPKTADDLITKTLIDDVLPPLDPLRSSIPLINVNSPVPVVDFLPNISPIIDASPTPQPILDVNSSTIEPSHYFNNSAILMNTDQIPNAMNISNNYILSTPAANANSSDKIIEFFTSIELSKYISNFIEEEWDWESLLEITNEDLLEMGIKVGSRRKILNAIQRFKSNKDSEENHLRNSGSKDREFWDIDFNAITLTDFLGNGFYGSVYRGSWNNVDVAVKKLSKLENFDYDKWMLEVRLLLELRHPNIVTCYCACTQFPNYCIVLEYLPRGSLLKVLKDKSIEIEYQRILIFAIDCAKGMIYLHDRSPPIIHRDLKSDNLLVTEDWHVKVSDFGLSRVKDYSYSYTQPTSPFDVTITAPEVLTKNHISEKSDVYSFGLLLWELQSRSRPFEGMNPHWVAQSVINDELRPPLADTEHWSEQYVTLMKECWAQDYRFRPSFKEILLKLELLYKLEVHPETVLVLPSAGYV